jgi:hypothetical protein
MRRNVKVDKKSPLLSSSTESQTPGKHSVKNFAHIFCFEPKILFAAEFFDFLQKITSFLAMTTFDVWEQSEKTRGD